MHTQLRTHTYTHVQKSGTDTHLNMHMYTYTHTHTQLCCRQINVAALLGPNSLAVINIVIVIIAIYPWCTHTQTHTVQTSILSRQFAQLSSPSSVFLPPTFPPPSQQYLDPMLFLFLFSHFLFSELFSFILPFFQFPLTHVHCAFAFSLHSSHQLSYFTQFFISHVILSFITLTQSNQITYGFMFMLKYNIVSLFACYFILEVTQTHASHFVLLPDFIGFPASLPITCYLLSDQFSQNTIYTSCCSNFGCQVVNTLLCSQPFFIGLKSFCFFPHICMWFLHL